ncbi:hypothetical protein PYCCODRAFT_1161694 [Trametes coccinea BRFM310]|uniref:Uncharacterized protein n=1 Tax=Trametes coccinea (strain BRFM310) TaxID=1353009 RepID=A0A1Y2IX11_TRAC3|nr:hypothetical protein PYCCODRAFT_1161694 [Trametes coccinea BRFM310]
MAFGSIFKKKTNVDVPTPAASGSQTPDDTLVEDTPSASTSTTNSPFLVPKSRIIHLGRGDEPPPPPVRRFGDRIIVESSGEDTAPAVRKDRIRRTNQFYIPHRSRYIIKHDLKPGDPVLALDYYRGLGTWRHGVVANEKPQLFGHYVHFPVLIKFNGEEKIEWHYPISGKILYDTLLAEPGARETYMA